MKRYVIAAISCLALIVGVSPAAAGDGLGGILQTVTQTTQQNTNRSGDATASNENGTWQGNDQSQTGYGGDATSGSATTGGSGCCGSGGDATSGDAYGGDVTQSQEAANTNSTTQEATATSKATQVLPVNVNVPVCLALACQTGDVTQSNTNDLGRRVGVELQPHRPVERAVPEGRRRRRHERRRNRRLGRRHDRQGGRRRRRPVADGVELQRDDPVRDGHVEGDADPAGERQRAGLHREALRDG